MINRKRIAARVLLLTLVVFVLALLSTAEVRVRPAQDGLPAYASLVTRSQIPGAGIWCVAYTGLDSGLPGGIAHRCGINYLNAAGVQHACSFNLPPSVTGFPRWYDCGPH